MTRTRNASHGTRSKYTTGCRCDDCRAANTAYQADWERRNPAAKARHDAHRTANGVRSRVQVLRRRGEL